jgi:hypothetical protein
MQLSDIKAGDAIQLDAGFTCRAAGPVEVKAAADGKLYFDCAGPDADAGHGHKHFLDGQEDDSGELVGISPAPSPDRTPAGLPEKLIVERATDKAGFRGISLRTSGLRYVANMVGQMDDSEMAIARALATRFNVHNDLVALAKQFEQTVVFYVMQDERIGDAEGAAMKSVTLRLIRETLTKAEGR